MKQYIGIARDHSGSMSSLRTGAIKDYNDTVSAIKTAASDNNIDTIASVVTFGGRVETEAINSSIQRLKPINYYAASGGTPLFDAVSRLIGIIENTPDQRNPDVTNLIIAITDGEENTSITTGTKLGEQIRKLQATDRWTFVFRVPRGYRKELERLGIPSGNIQEWDQTERGLYESSVQTQSAISNYYTGVTRGIKSSQSFYTDLSAVRSNTVIGTMKDISKEVAIFPVSTRTDIASFFGSKLRGPYEKGTGFYELMKPEKAVQGYKLIAIRNKMSGEVYAGQNARDLLSLPKSGTIRLVPKDHGDWDIYIQSTSTNRILPAGTTALYWKSAARP